PRRRTTWPHRQEPEGQGSRPRPTLPHVSSRQDGQRQDSRGGSSVSVYFDSAYIAKCYVNETDSPRVRALLRASGGAHSSSLSRAEFAATLLRHLREGSLDRKQCRKLQSD